MDLREFAPVGRRPTSERKWSWLERLAEMCQDLPNRPRLGDERDQADFATARRAQEGKLLPPRAMSFAPAIREVSWERGFAVVSQQTLVP